MNSGNDLLIDQLDSISQPFASFGRVIIHATELLTRESGTHDFTHSEAVHNRLSELLPDAHQFGLNEAEIFILIASAYLHDIGHLNAPNGQKHGKFSADMINTDGSLKYLFLAGDIQNHVAKVCYYHDREIEELTELEKNVNLDIRPCHWFKRGNMRVRPRMLGAILRLADELECNSDRFLVQSANKDNPRIIIAGVRLDLESRCISLDFKQGAKEEDRNRCTEYLHGIFGRLATFLSPYEPFKIVDKLPETELIDEEEGVDDAQVVSIDDVQEGPKPLVQPQKAVNFDDLKEVFEKERMKRIDSVTSILPERSKR